MGRGGPARLAQRRAALPPQLPPAAEKARVEELRRAAKADLPDRIGRLSRITGLKYNKLTIRASRTKWGSCTGTNNISLSLFLMTLPEHLRDFVIVHELCHTVHHDHSPKFHALVDRLVGGNEKALNRELKAFSGFGADAPPKHNNPIKGTPRSAAAVRAAVKPCYFRCLTRYCSSR